VETILRAWGKFEILVMQEQVGLSYEVLFDDDARVEGGIGGNRVLAFFRYRIGVREDMSVYPEEPRPTMTAGICDSERARGLSIHVNSTTEFELCAMLVGTLWSMLAGSIYMKEMQATSPISVPLAPKQIHLAAGAL
jgi:hypothetical protein